MNAFEARQVFEKYLENPCPNEDCHAQADYMCDDNPAVWIHAERVALYHEGAMNARVSPRDEKIEALTHEYNKLSEQFIKFSIAYNAVLDAIKDNE